MNTNQLVSTPDTREDKILTMLSSIISGLEALNEKLEELEEKINDMDRDFGNGFDIRRYDN